MPIKEEQEDIHSGYPDDIPLIDPSYSFGVTKFFLFEVFFWRKIIFFEIWPNPTKSKINKLGWRVRQHSYTKLFEVLGEFIFFVVSKIKRKKIKKKLKVSVSLFFISRHVSSYVCRLYDYILYFNGRMIKH